MCTTFLHELLDLIENRMIVVMAPGRDRIESADLHKKLESMYRRVCDPMDTYCQSPCPEERPVNNYLPVDAHLSDHAHGLMKSRHPKIKSYSGRTQTSKTPDQFRAME